MFILGFVKGNETDMETAIRVTKEETGIQAAKDLEIFENFEKTLKVLILNINT